MVSNTDPFILARFLHKELPVRYAERIRWIEDIPDWHLVPGLEEVHAKHVHTFEDMLAVKRRPSLDPFTEVIQEGVEQQREVPMQVASAMHHLNEERGESFGSEFIDRWLDEFLLNRIGTDMLMSHYLVLVSKEGRPTGVVDPRCDVGELSRGTAMQVVQMCESLTGRSPLIEVETHSAAVDDKGRPTFSYVPSFLNYILTEILKNSCRATVEVSTSFKDMQRRKIKVIVCADDQHVAIRVTDLAKGIPFDTSRRVWSYLYSTARKAQQYGDNAPGVTPLAGYGVGLPLSKLYAQYLGGSLSLVSLPGYGTSVDIFLHRCESDQVEVVPDNDN
eukprot:gnl/TRDRNA2_/TRDRNA2_81873_c1_seq1.p1 gnl/TRDRNA2_/TRDRNA2_81873_c1~~gnl/TRDRNA2_/TRDRNA2_81873_c1_seq1.p1  ORF type:complete len:379 (-),score=58.57 gnl/TRDRNA2_/TRDRNA2_81873_c1_seq1:70-1068(-)